MVESSSVSAPWCYLPGQPMDARTRVIRDVLAALTDVEQGGRMLASPERTPYDWEVSYTAERLKRAIEFYKMEGRREGV